MQDGGNDPRAAVKEKHVALNEDITVAQDQEQLLGEWMILKRKPNSNKIKNRDGKKAVTDYEGKRQVMRNKGNVLKSHVLRDSHAKNSQLNND